MQPTNPKHYFCDNDLSDWCAVIRFLYTPSLNQIDLVLNYYAECTGPFSQSELFQKLQKINSWEYPPAPHDYRHLRFTNVRVFQLKNDQTREIDLEFANRTYDEDDSYWQEYERLLSPNSLEIGGVYSQREGARVSTWMSMGYRLNSYHWEFDEMLVERRIGYPIDDNSGVMIDTKTEEKFTFDTAFPNMMKFVQ